jgi:hypothetical protein
MIDEQHRPKRPPIEKRALGKLETRTAMQKAKGMQNLSPSRYNLEEVAKGDMKKAMEKVSQKKLRVAGTMTGRPADPVTIEPEKMLTGQGLQM